jgi:hypothetical protein
MTLPWNAVSLDDLCQRLWIELGVAAGQVGNPWRCPVLSTVSPAGPEARVVVLRSVDPAARELTAHSDLRASKVGQLRADDRSVWVFYDPLARVQMRARCRVTVHDSDGRTQEAWRRTPVVNRMNYLQRHPPGEVITAPSVGWENRLEDRPEFGLLVARVEELDALWLKETGHLRARFTWMETVGGTRWHGDWIAP